MAAMERRARWRPMGHRVSACPTVLIVKNRSRHRDGERAPMGRGRSSRSGFDQAEHDQQHAEQSRESQPQAHARACADWIAQTFGLSKGHGNAPNIF